MYDHVVKCQRAGLCLSEHFLICYAALLPSRTLSVRLSVRPVIVVVAIGYIFSAPLASHRAT